VGVNLAKAVKEESKFCDFDVCGSKEKEWARSIFDRLNHQKRKATKGVKHLPEDFEKKTKREYQDRIDKVVKENNIPDQLVINWDQTVII
jgi:hypothetical protein